MPPPIYSALWPVGRHPATWIDFENRCVTAFPLSRTRQAIAHGLWQMATALATAGIEGDIWVDGSFVTSTIDPNDADVVLSVAGEFYDESPPDRQAAIDWVSTNLKVSHLCDSYLLFRWAEGHPLYWLGESMYAYWMKQWAFDRENNLKGMPVLQIRGGSIV